MGDVDGAVVPQWGRASTPEPEEEIEYDIENPPPRPDSPPRVEGWRRPGRQCQSQPEEEVEYDIENPPPRQDSPPSEPAGAQSDLPNDQSAAEFLFSRRRSAVDFQQFLDAKQHRRSSVGVRSSGTVFNQSVVFNQIRSSPKEDPSVLEQPLSVLDSRQYVLPSKPKSRRVSKNRRRSSKNRQPKSRRVSKNRRRSSKNRKPKSRRVSKNRRRSKSRQPKSRRVSKNRRRSKSCQPKSRRASKNRRRSS